MALTLEDGPSRVARLMSTPRMLLANDPTIRHFANSVASIETVPAMRFAHVDLDYIYDPDPAQTDRNLGELVQRIVDMQINTVFLQAYADPQADGLVRSVYFRTAGCRCGPTCSTASPGSCTTAPMCSSMPGCRCWRWTWTRRSPAWSAGIRGPRPRPRRIPTCTAACRRSIRSRASASATCTKTWRAMPSSTASCSTMTRCWATSRTPARRRWPRTRRPACPAASPRCADPETMQRWTRYKSRHLVDFTAELAERARAVRGPRIKTARNLYAEPLLNPASEAWFAQNPDDFLDAYDWTAPMAMPYMEKVPAGQELAWLDRIVDAVARRRPDALDRTVFELQAVDWRTGPGRADARRHRDAGRLDAAPAARARSFGYYPDDFSQDQPRLQGIRPAISEAWFPIR